MTRKIMLTAFVVISLILLNTCKDQPYQSYSHVKWQPPGALQLDPGVFVPDDSLIALGLELGDVVDVRIGDTRFQANVYPYLYDAGEMGINSFTLKRYNIERGDLAVYLAKAQKPEISTQPLKMHGESYPGDLKRWGSFVISTPHGDCDLFTGEIAEALSQRYGLPASAYYHPRFTFLGRWYDANRPLGKAPREDGHWTIPERIWNTEIDSLFRAYEQIIRSTAGVEAGEPLDFLCSFHGHDLKMKDSEGNRVNREVIEAYGSGFSQDEYRLMIQWFNELSAEHFDVQPLLVFGNLPEHQKYTIDNQTFNFWYTGLGTRSYGTLRKTNTVRGLHMETPNSMRFNIEAREKTILTMAAFFERVHAELMYPQKVLDKPLERKRVEVATVELPAAVFNYRKKMVSVLPLKASTTEVTIDEFASYLNELLKQNKAQIDMEHRRVNGTNGELICFLDAYSEDDMLLVEEGLISAAANRGNYPMTNLTWHAAVDYAEFRGGRLPTETEWVRLAGYWDDELHTYATEHDDYEHLEQNINFEGSLDAKTGCTYPQDLPVATLPANGNGLYDMSGNVWEWCSDWFHSQYYRNLEAEMTHADPRGPESGTMRTTKGGSWGAGVEVTKTSYRVALAPELTLADLGFRIVWDL